MGATVIPQYTLPHSLTRSQHSTWAAAVQAFERFSPAAAALVMRAIDDRDEVTTPPFAHVLLRDGGQVFTRACHRQCWSFRSLTGQANAHKRGSNEIQNRANI